MYTVTIQRETPPDLVERIKSALAAIKDIEVAVNRSDVDKLCDKIRQRPSLFNGLVTYEDVAGGTGTLEMDLVNQVRYNGVSLDVLFNGENGYDWANKTNPSNFDSWSDMWSCEMHGEMLEDLGGVVLIMLFGCTLDDRLKNMILGGALKIAGMSDQDVQLVFNDYPTFVDQLVNGVDLSNIYYDVDVGTDS